jgi:hypothetical protein
MWVEEETCTKPILTGTGHLSQRHLHLPAGGHVRILCISLRASSLTSSSYFVTELLGTDLHRLLTSRPLEKQFIQYFLYQILVRLVRHMRVL